MRVGLEDVFGLEFGFPGEVYGTEAVVFLEEDVVIEAAEVLEVHEEFYWGFVGEVVGVVDFVEVEVSEKLCKLWVFLKFFFGWRVDVFYVGFVGVKGWCGAGLEVGAGLLGVFMRMV